MTLDEAIKHAEEVMVENLEKSKSRNASDPIAINCGECADNHRQLAEWLKELKQLREYTRWIPVSERLPEKSGRYLAYIVNKYDTNYRYIMTCEYIEDSYWRWFPDDDCASDNVVAWMPLPEPYMAESEGNE